MKDAKQVTAAVQIVAAVRSAVVEATEQHATTSWDAEALTFEMTRLLGLMYRTENVTPARLDELIRLLRQVYAGLYPAQAMSVEQAIDFFCPEQTPEQPSAESPDSSSGCTVH
jgi:hypothetical protein